MNNQNAVSFNPILNFGSGQASSTPSFVSNPSNSQSPTSTQKDDFKIPVAVNGGQASVGGSPTQYDSLGRQIAENVIPINNTQSDLAQGSTASATTTISPTLILIGGGLVLLLLMKGKK